MKLLISEVKERYMIDNDEFESTDQAFETDSDAASASGCGPRAFPYRDRKGKEPSYTCEVPATTHYIYMQAGGGSGGYGTDDDFHSSGGPGGGGNIAGLIPVVPGETLSIFVGQGARHDWHAMDGYAPGGQGGDAWADTAAHGGAGGGSTAVIGSKSGMLIQAGGGGGAGGRGGQADGGDGGQGRLDPRDGTRGSGAIGAPGGRGGMGGDPKLTDHGGNGGSSGTSSTFGGGGGGGGGGWHCGDGGQEGDPLGGGGGGGGGGASFIVGSAIGIKEPTPRSPQKGYVTFTAESSVRSTAGSAIFPNVHLRMDPHGVTRDSPVGGTVNCQFGAAELERFNVRVLANGNVAFESVAAPGVYLRMDGSEVRDFTESGGGVVNCQFGPGELTEFRIVAQPNGVAAIESVKYPGVFLRMDGRGVNRFLDSGGGIVNCQFGAKGWETFRLFAPAS